MSYLWYNSTYIISIAGTREHDPTAESKKEAKEICAEKVFPDLVKRFIIIMLLTKNSNVMTR